MAEPRRTGRGRQQRYWFADRLLRIRVKGSPLGGLLIVGLGTLIVPLDTSVNIAFPDITSSFGVPIAAIQWVVVCYVLTNAALMLAKSARRKPRDIAEAIAQRLAALDHVATVEVAGPGFVNLRLADFVWHEELRTVLKLGLRYGDCTAGGGQAQRNHVATTGGGRAQKKLCRHRRPPAACPNCDDIITF